MSSQDEKTVAQIFAISNILHQACDTENARIDPHLEGFSGIMTDGVLTMDRWELIRAAFKLAHAIDPEAELTTGMDEAFCADPWSVSCSTAERYALQQLAYSIETDEMLIDPNSETYAVSLANVMKSCDLHDLSKDLAMELIKELFPEINSGINAEGNK